MINFNFNKYILLHKYFGKNFQKQKKNKVNNFNVNTTNRVWELKEKVKLKNFNEITIKGGIPMFY